MTQPTSGITHDVVIQIDPNNLVGLIARPGSYRVVKPPAFIPRFSVGDPKGIDFSRWRSFVQDDFSGGSGQYLLSASSGNNRYAESQMVELGIPGTYVGEAIGGKDYLGQTPLSNVKGSGGVATIAVVPQQSSTLTRQATLFSGTYPVHVLPFSNAPHLLHNKALWVYTNVAYSGSIGDSPSLIRILGDPLAGGPWAGMATDMFKGVWVANNTQVAGTGAQSKVTILSAVKHSNTLFAAIGNTIQAYGSASGTAPSQWYTPTFTTQAALLANFDTKLWRTVGHQVAFFDQSLGAWSIYYPAGDASSPIRRTKAFSGKLLLGKSESLWAYDAGRVYEIQNFATEEDITNFALMETLKGDLYFNIKNTIYRLTSANNFEKLDFPQFSGTVINGTATDNLLYILIADESQQITSWIFNPDTGGAHAWFASKDLMQFPSPQPQGPTSIQHALGVLWVAPLALTTTMRSDGVIAGISLTALPSRQSVPGYLPDHNLSYLITSELDFTLPTVTKQFDRVVVDFNLNSVYDSIDVYYLTAIRQRPAISAVLWNAGFNPSGFSNVTVGLTDGDFVTPAWPFPSNFATNDYIYVGFNTPVRGLQLFNDNSNNGFLGGAVEWQNWKVEYCSGDGQFRPLVKNASHGGASLRPDAIDGPWSSGRGMLTWPVPGDWKASTIAGAFGYYIRITNPSLPDGYAESGFNQYEYTPVTFSPNLRAPALANATWQLLGSINSTTAPFNNRLELPFPDSTIAETMMLKFVFNGSRVSAPQLVRYNIKWMPIGPDPEKIQVQMTALAINGLETLQPTVVENSAAFISKSLFSMDGAGKTYIVQLPYPHPVGHTRRMTVHLDTPGITPHTLTYAHTMGDIGANIEAEIPIILTEM